VNLVAEYDSVEACHLPPKAKPPIHHLADWLRTPETQIESPPHLNAATGDSGANAVELPPTRNLKAGDFPRDGDFGNFL
jgi:hypothetical protein